MLADDRAVADVVFGEGGIAGAPALHIGQSTISVALADQLAAESGGGGYVSAPVFGRPPAAAAGKLFVVVAGAQVALDLCDPVFAQIGQRTFQIGHTPSAANLIKLSGNFMIMAAVEAMAEAMTLAEKGGVDRRTLLEVLTGTLFGAPVYQTYGEILVEDRFKPAGFTAPLGLKDMTLVDTAATSFGASMPLLGIVRDHLRSVIATDGPDVDWAGIALAVQNSANIRS
jgi:3-hydroxyisobutyrate dehydrogenase-like beta-hydroxyacid dehydrogenase